MKKLFPALLIAFLLYSSVIFLSASFKNYDTQSYNVIGVLTLNGISIYPDPAISRHPYLPFFLFLESGALLLSRFIHVPQIIILKFIFTLFHLFSVYVIYELTKKNLKIAFLYAVNPLSLLITAFHGQFDIIPLTLILYSILLLPEKKYSNIMFLLGLAFTAKTWPILFVVPFLKRIPKKFWLIFCIPPLIFLLMYTALFFSTSFISIARVLAVYQGVGGIWGFGKVLSILEADKITLFIYKALFVIGLLVYAVFQKKGQIVEEISNLLIAFFVFTPGFGIQWFIWLTPFFFLSKRPLFSFLYTPLCIAACVAYLSWHPVFQYVGKTVDLVLLATSSLFLLYAVLSYFYPHISNNAKRKHDNHYRRHIVVILVVIGCVIILELFLRLLYPTGTMQAGWWTNRSDYVSDTNLIYSGVTNAAYTLSGPEFSETVTTNALGYRDDEFQKKKPNTYRILAVGDSFTFGHGIKSNEKSYPKLLQKQLNARRGSNTKDIEVFNMAVKGYSPDQEYRQIQQQVDSLQPDMVLWNFSLPGDMYNLIHVPQWPVPSLYDVRNNTLFPLDARFNWLYISKYIKEHSPSFVGNSRIFNLLTYAASQIRIASRKPYKTDADMNLWAMRKIHLEIENIQKLAKEKRIQLVIVLLPYPEQFNTHPGEKSLAFAYGTMMKSAKEIGVPFVDMKSSILKEKNHLWSELYFKTDYHPNQNGVMFFAETVGEVITPFILLN